MILLTSGQLANSKGAIYTVPTAMRAELRHVRLFNTTGGALTCNVYVNDGTSRKIYGRSLPSGEFHIVVDENAPIGLSAGHILEADTSSATSVNFHIWGRLMQVEGA